MSEKERKYLAYFDCEGFECLEDITSRERKYLLASIKNEGYRDDLNLHAMMLRARYNPQRSPEIWVFTTSVDDSTIQQLREEQPQMLVDLIRKHGTSVWQSSPQKRVIQ